MNGIVSLLAAMAILTAINSAQAEDRNTTQVQGQQAEPLPEGRENVSGEKLREPGTTDMGRENDDNITRPWTRDDVVRDILRNRPGPKGIAGPTPGVGAQ
jgi:hypothetical protein